MAFAGEVVEDYFVWHIVSVAAVETCKCKCECEGLTEGGTEFILTVLRLRQVLVEDPC